MSELVLGSSVPLFDRLGYVGSTASGPSALLSPEQLQLSIGREMANLLNTRSSCTADEFLLCDGTTLDYGVPDMGHLSPQSADDLMVLEVIVKRAIGLFEPRLRDVKVQANVSGMTSGRPNLAISGLVSIDMKLMQLNFELQLDTKMSPLGKVE